MGFVTNLTSCLTVASGKKSLIHNNASTARCGSSLITSCSMLPLPRPLCSSRNGLFPHPMAAWVPEFLYHVLTHSPPALVMLNWTEARMGTARCDSPEKLNFWRLYFPPGLTVNSFCSCRTSRAARVVSISVLPQPLLPSHNFRLLQSL